MAKLGRTALRDREAVLVSAGCLKIESVEADCAYKRQISPAVVARLDRATRYSREVEMNEKPRRT